MAAVGVDVTTAEEVALRKGRMSLEWRLLWPCGKAVGVDVATIRAWDSRGLSYKRYPREANFCGRQVGADLASVTAIVLGGDDRLGSSSCS
ncbi:hypothetical protein ACLOJK_006469 [Asimina triloba]